METYLGKHTNFSCANKLRNLMKQKNIRKMLALFTSAVLVPSVLCSQIAMGSVDKLTGYYYKKSNTVEWLSEKIARLRLGPVTDKWEGRKNSIFCMESSVFIDYKGNIKQMNGEDYRIAANIIKTHNNNDDDLTQAALAFMIHNHFDINQDRWKEAVENGFVDVETETLRNKADKLWQQGVKETPVKAVLKNDYTKGKRIGVMHISLQNSNGDSLGGVPIKVKSSNNLIKFANGSESFEGKSKKEGLDITWNALDAGNARIEVSFNAPKAERLFSPDGQDVIRSFENTWYPQDFSFGVEKTFQPLLKSKISKHELRAGEQVDSTVTSSVAGNDSWPENVRLRAQGYYFVGSAEDILHIQQRNSGESAKEYLNRMRSMPNLRQVAAAKANFSNSGETITAVAKRANGDITASDLDKAEAYKVNDLEAGLFGTWVWIISRDSQNKSDREFLKDDVVQLFGSTDTTAVHQATVSSDIVAKQQTVGLNTEIVNEITVRGLPETYGSFKGNNSYGFNEDKKAHIRVWWAGAGSENPTKKDNENYMPGSKGEPSYQEPKEDSHHRLIAKWDVPAVNGVYKIGNGNITLRPIAGTDRSTTEPKVLENNVHIRANKNSESGWYVFVYDFPGSSRALAHKSAYDGLWSRALVEPDVLTTPVSVTTRVSDEKVKAGEKFHDNARITGTLPKGSYVVFSAYEYEDGKGNKSDSNGAKCSDAKNGDAKNGDAKNGSDSETKEIKKAKKAKETKETKETVISAEIEKKMPQSRVNITNKQAEESKKSSISVSSADITLDHEGTVYWKAEVYDAQGNPLATHALGVEGETVQVSGGEDRSKNDENEENNKENKENVEENHSKTGSDDSTDSKNDVNDNASNQHDSTNSNENANKNYVNRSNTIPTSLAVTGASSITVILLAVITLTFASGLSLGRFSSIVPKHGRMSGGARHGGIPPMRRRLVK
ncbi:peptidase [Gardnerella swidsinskii]|uniref:peptidase n=1 Tax=Gardnerella swidsinskii TaxID=2792979 RepID=UPI000E2F72E7|nr:peptidase [Gardnerella swidsinskii]